MKDKYVILDEITIQIIVDENGNPVVFNSKKKAREYAEKEIQAWQIIEIPFA